MVIVFTAVAIVAAGAFDLALLGQGLSLTLATIARPLFVVLSIAAILAIRGQASVRRFDTTIFLWLMTLITGMLSVSSFSPPSYAVAAVWHVLAVATLYTVLPVPLVVQVIPALLLSLGDVGHWLLVRSAQATWATTATIVAAHAFANAVGIAVSRRRGRARRELFSLLQKERQARRQLEKAAAEISALQGILPICSHCKNIRNDDGYYEAVELYLRRHTELDFSHTCCPECMAEFYPEVEAPTA